MTSDREAIQRLPEQDKDDFTLRPKEQEEGGYTEFFSVGCDFDGQLGDGSPCESHDRNRSVNVPKSLSFDILISLVECGKNHSLLLSQNSELLAIGSN